MIKPKQYQYLVLLFWLSYSGCGEFQEKQSLEQEPPTQEDSEDLGRGASSAPEITGDFFIIKKGDTGPGIIREKIQKEDIKIHINQIVSANFPEVQLLISITSPEGYPVEINNPKLLTLLENKKSIPKSDILEVLKRKDVETLIPLSMVLAIDKSGSMAYEQGSKLTLQEQPLSYAKKSAIAFIEKLQVLDEVRVLAFDGYLYDLGKNAQAIQEIKKLVPSGYTALYGALYRSLLSLQSGIGVKAIILLTDGKNDLRPNSGSTNKIRRITLQKGLALADKLSIPVFTIGFGVGHDQKMLGKIADKTHSLYFNTSDKSQLESLYDNIRHIMDNQYIITYKSSDYKPKIRITVDISGRQDTREYYPKPQILQRAIAYKENLLSLKQEKKKHLTLYEHYSQKLQAVEEKDKNLNVFLSRLKVYQDTLHKEKASFLELQRYFQSINDYLSSKKQEVELSLSSMTTEIEEQHSTLLRAITELHKYEEILDTKRTELDDLAHTILHKDQLLKERSESLFTKQKEIAIRAITLSRSTGNIELEISRLSALRNTINSQRNQLKAQFTNLNKARLLFKEQKQKINTEKLHLKDFKKELEQMKQQLQKDRAHTAKEKKQLELSLERLRQKQKHLETFQENLRQFLGGTITQLKGMNKKSFQVPAPKKQAAKTR